MRADASCVLIHDAFPKAQHHALVLPREAGLHDVTSLTRDHLPLLAHMQARPAGFQRQQICAICGSEGFCVAAGLQSILRSCVTADAVLGASACL